MLQFIVKCFSFVSQIYDFRIRFVQFVMRAVNIQALKIRGQQNFLITSYILSHQTIPESIETSQIVYSIIMPPKYGFILSTEVIKSSLHLIKLTKL